MTTTARRQCSRLGPLLRLVIKAVNCVSGESLTSTEAQAGDKNHALDALDQAASSIRNKLGESLSTMRKFDTPVEQATTPSLEALQAYSLARKVQLGKGDNAGAVPLYERAISLDPNFALAYSAPGACYYNLGETSLAAKNTSRGYELRERVSEAEKLGIESRYQHFVTGNLEKARQAYELCCLQRIQRFQPILVGSIGTNAGDSMWAATNRKLSLMFTNSVWHGDLPLN